ncbi:MAG: PKD domain-containing protein, partial [Odoribacter sp.]|nr:PKD domain-containing protein [Odoribacter sp.]
MNLDAVAGSDMFTNTFKTVHGCDSIVTLDLHVWETWLMPVSKNMPEGDTLDFRGMKLYETGVYDDTLKTAHGCDSIFRMDLTVRPVTRLEFSDAICSGSAYNHFGFHLPAVYVDTIVHDTSDNSIRTLSLTVYPSYNLSLFDTICQGELYSEYGFHVSEPGVHRRYLLTKAGCDSLVTLTLTEEKKVGGAIGLALEDCSTHGYTFFFEPQVEQASWQWDMGDGSTLRAEEGEGFHYYADSGTYEVQLRIETYNGCENLFSYVQYVPPYLADVPILADRTAIDEEFPSVRFRAEVLPGMECRWDFGDGTTGEGESVTHTYDVSDARFYDVTLQVVNADSCVTESRMRIEVLFFPKAVNTFTPNGDGINDVFMGEFRIEIVNRNGLLIYKGENGWDGSYKG